MISDYKMMVHDFNCFFFHKAILDGLESLIQT